MAVRTKHNAGFTLAELLIVIAIILVLAALAIPSIITAQNNMRMMELNNAAESIANAAQTQMTAKKAAGTWLALIDGPDGKVKYPAATGSADSDTYYMVADDLDSLQGARSNGIVPSLSIDDAVRNGDYVIVFKASTASVEAVYYTDGKSGFFDSFPAHTNAAQIYYASHGSTDQAARMKNDPMIGYYQGTPAGATEAVALQNPVIWVDELGRLCIQNPNITNNSMMPTTLGVSISIKGEEDFATIALSGLDAKGGGYAVSSGDLSDSYSNSVKETQIYDVTSRDMVDNNVFRIDLNDLKRVLESSATDQGKALAVIVQKLASSNANLHVLAAVSSSDPAMPSIPATAEAYMEWPEKIATLTVMVTNPALDAQTVEGGKKRSSASHISGTYVDPQTKLITDSGDEPVTDLSMKDQQAIFNLDDAGIETNSILKEENVESSRQSYSGGWVKLADAISQTSKDVNVYAQVTAGTYTSDPSSEINVSKMVNPGNGSLLWQDGGSFSPSGKAHAYQIYEIWVNGERAGYIDQGEWAWEKSDLGDDFSQCVDPITSDSTEVKINLSRLYDLVPRDFDGYEVYVRTTPKASEVKQYFVDNMDRIKDYFTGKQRTTGMRGVNLGAPIRQPFENEFGASSTVALFNITSASPTDKYNSESVRNDGKSFFVSDDIRVYYSATSALAWKGNASNASVYTEVPSAQLWGFKKEDQFRNVLPDAYVEQPRSSNEPYALTSTTSADFELSTQRDGLFYRVLEYCDDKGKRIEDMPLIYVPYTVQDSASFATIADAPSREGFLARWQAPDASIWPPENTITMEPGKLVSAYANSLKYGHVKLTAFYEELPKGAGVMYMEFMKDGRVGYAGYVGVGASVEPSLIDGESMQTWGYYVVVPDEQGDNEIPVITGNANSLVSLSKSPVSVSIGGKSYRAYGLASKKSQEEPGRYIELDLNYKKVNSRLYVNLDFAGAVSDSQEEAEGWGLTEGAPWNVRHADQFIGSLFKTSGGNALAELYLGDCFLQTRNFDMADRTAVYKFDAVFRGVYDGGGHSISNVHVNQVEYYVPNGDQTGLPRGSSTLFPKIAGTQEKRSALKNIKIVEDPSNGSATWKVNPVNAYFGLLAGVVSYCDVSNCGVVGTEEVDGKPVEIIAETRQTGVKGWGVLIGGAYDSKVDDSYVNDIVLDVMHTGGKEWSENVAFGAVVGYASNTPMEGCSASNVKVGTKTRAIHEYQGRQISAGGLVGMLDGSSSLTKGKVAKVVLVVPENQAADKNKLFFGALAGNRTTSNIAVEGDFEDGVWLKQGDEDIKVEKPVAEEMTGAPLASEYSEAREAQEPVFQDDSPAAAEQPPREPDQSPPDEQPLNEDSTDIENHPGESL